MARRELRRNSGHHIADRGVSVLCPMLVRPFLCGRRSTRKSRVAVHASFPSPEKSHLLSAPQNFEYYDGGHSATTTTRVGEGRALFQSLARTQPSSSRGYVEVPRGKNDNDTIDISDQDDEERKSYPLRRGEIEAVFCATRPYRLPTIIEWSTEFGDNENEGGVNDFAALRSIPQPSSKTASTPASPESGLEGGELQRLVAGNRGDGTIRTVASAPELYNRGRNHGDLSSYRRKGSAGSVLVSPPFSGRLPVGPRSSSDSDSSHGPQPPQPRGKPRESSGSYTSSAKNGGRRSVEPKRRVVEADMEETIQEDAVECATFAIENFDAATDIAAYVKREFDARHSGPWHCIVGKNFGSYVSHETKHFIYFALGKTAVLLFKAA